MICLQRLNCWAPILWNHCALANGDFHRVYLIVLTSSMETTPNSFPGPRPEKYQAELQSKIQSIATRVPSTEPETNNVKYNNSRSI